MSRCAFYFKDEVRRVGREMGIDELFISRHPFPGPGLGIRVLGAISEEKVKMLQEADAIYIQHLHDAGLYKEVWQAGAILLPVQSVGVMGDERTYEYNACPACRDQCRRHDCRLGAASIRFSGAGIQ